MKPGKGKSKGNSFENKTGRGLSLWLTEDADKTQLIPSRLSGGWQDAAARHAGDLAANGPVGERFRQHFVVECKHRKTELLWTMYNVLGENVQGWWVKLCGEATEFDLLPMLVCKQNHRPVLVGLPSKLARHVVREGPLTGPLLIHTTRGIYDCGLLLWHTLVAWEPEEFYALTERLYACS